MLDSRGIFDKHFGLYESRLGSNGNCHIYFDVCMA